MSSFVTLPEQIKSVYREVWKLDPSAIIAGGAIRDTICRRPVKDVDIFIRRQNAHKFTKDWSTIGTSRGVDLGRIEAASTAYNTNHVVKVYERYDLILPANLIVVDIDPIVYVTEHFDFGICKAWYDGSFIHTHKDFIADLNNNTITLTLDDSRLKELYPRSVTVGLQKIKEHALRIQRKYPKFRIVMPEV